MTNKEKKIELRKTLLAKRDELALNYKAILDKAVIAKLEAIISERRPKVIHSYLPFDGEIDILPLLQTLLDEKITVVCPRALPKRELQNLVLHSLSELEEGRFGTKHPANSTVYTGDIDMFIVPGVGFSEGGYRLGYGAGYYDTFFGSYPRGFKVGVCYQFQVISDLPIEAHDVPLDTVVF
jgi:5-formyltetrahydrofolate cyclo-ligase